MSSHQRTKVSVPENEYHAALTTLKESLCAPSLRNVNQESDTSSSPHSPLLKDIHNSILATIQRSIEPIPTADFEKMQIFGSTPVKRQIQKVMENKELREDDLSVSSCSTDDDSETMTSSSHESDLDEEDLLDEQVWERAKDLREKVRMASRKLQCVREDKMSQALIRIQSELNDLIRLETQWEEEFEKNLVERGKDGKSHVVDSETQVNMKDMETSLIQLKIQLEEMQNVLPENLQAIKDTIESVTLSLHKKMRGEWSNTEKAIQLRDCNDVWRSGKNTQSNLSTEDVHETGHKIDAAKRFALFVSRP